MISENMSMCQALLEHPQLLPLLPRFGIRFGIGEATVEEVCRRYGVDPGFFMEIANAYLDEAYVASEDLSHFSLGTMVEYLKSTHTYYLESAMPKVEEDIHNLLGQSALTEKEVTLVTGFFNDYKKEFLAHISEEEDHILPYILELEAQSMQAEPDEQFIGKLREYSIRQFATEHDRLEYSLENLSRLIIKYLPPPEDEELCIRILRDLSLLVKDLIDHAQMEDKVLIPKVAELEQQLLRKTGQA